jgi:hypothetical protein
MHAATERETEHRRSVSSSPTVPKSGVRANGIVEPSERVKRVKRRDTLREDLMKACKRFALDTNRRLHELMKEAYPRSGSGIRS